MKKNKLLYILFSLSLLTIIILYYLSIKSTDYNINNYDSSIIKERDIKYQLVTDFKLKNALSVEPVEQNFYFVFNDDLYYFENDYIPFAQGISHKEVRFIKKNIDTQDERLIHSFSGEKGININKVVVSGDTASILLTNLDKNIMEILTFNLLNKSISKVEEFNIENSDEVITMNANDDCILYHKLTGIEDEYYYIYDMINDNTDKYSYVGEIVTSPYFLPFYDKGKIMYYSKDEEGYTLKLIKNDKISYVDLDTDYSYGLLHDNNIIWKDNYSYGDVYISKIGENSYRKISDNGGRLRLIDDKVCFNEDGKVVIYANDVKNQLDIEEGDYIIGIDDNKAFFINNNESIFKKIKFDLE